jgi:hypothetical protein
VARKAGRKRKSGVRQPDGRLNPTKKAQNDPLNVPQAVIRRIIAHSMLGDMEVTQFATLRIRNEVTQPMYDAGIKYREDYAAFQSAIEVKRVGAATLEPSFGSGYDLTTATGQAKDEASQRAVKRYESLIAVLDEVTARDLHALIVNHEYLDWARLHSAKNGLKELAIHLRLMRRGALD